MKDTIVAFSDGAAKGNPGPSGWGAIVWRPDGRVVELGGGSPRATNNQMELSGVIAALEAVAGEPEPIAIHTDSTYVIRGITQWIWGWRRKGWKTATGTDVLNRDLWERLLRATSARGNNKISWHYVRGHVGVPGNERCDEIAVAFAAGTRPRLYSGTFLAYQVDLTNVPEDTSLPPSSSKGKGAAKGKGKGKVSYLSEIGGVVERHTTWTECERRVKGRSGARFKKAKSPEEEAKILQDWGVR